MSTILEFDYQDCERKKNHWKVTSHCHCNCKFRDGVTSICNLKFNVPNDVPAVFNNGSNYDYHFTIKELGEEFKREFEDLREKPGKI